MRRFAFVAVCMLAGLAWPLVVSAEQSAEEFVKESVDEVLEIIYAAAEPEAPLSKRLYPVLEECFDLPGISKRAVGRPWLKFSGENQEAIVDLFSKLVLRTYADRFEAKHRPVIIYGKGSQLRKNVWEIPTTIEYQGSNYSVAYRLRLKKSTWKVYDVIIEGVSMVGNYRAQFSSIIKKGGAPALVDALQENIAREGEAE